VSPPPSPPGLAQREAALRRRAVHSSHNTDVREVVRLRASDACEYCLLPTAVAFEVEHIIPRGLWDTYMAGLLPGLHPLRRRRGPDHIDNYAWSCPFCNRSKGGRVSYGAGRTATRFFDPRRDRWLDHFVFAPATGYLVILGASLVGATTVGPHGLDFNRGGTEGPLVSRHIAVLSSTYPPVWARTTPTI